MSEQIKVVNYLLIEEYVRGALPLAVVYVKSNDPTMSLSCRELGSCPSLLFLLSNHNTNRPFVLES